MKRNPILEAVIKMHLTIPNAQVYIFSTSCYLCLVMSGLSLAWPEPLTAWYSSSNSSVPMTEEEVSWMVSLVEAGAVLSPLPCGIMADVVGRKPVLLVSAAVAFLGWLLVLVTRSVPCLYVARILGGLTLGCAPTVAPIYIAEVAPPEIRGALSGQLVCMFFIGQLLAYSTGPYMSYQSYIWFCMAIPIVFFFSFIFAPETPFYYLKKNNLVAAEASMERLRGTVVQEELNQMFSQLKNDQDESKGSWRELFTIKTFKILTVLQVLSFVSHMNGLPSLSLYATETLGQTWITIGMGVIMTVTSFAAAFLIDPFGRKPLLVWSLLGSAVATAILAVYFVYLKQWIMFVGLIGFCVISSIGISPLIMTLQAELFPTSTRALASAITELTLSASSFICLKMFVPINNAYGVHVNFIIYTVLSVIGAGSVFFLPETSKTVMDAGCYLCLMMSGLSLAWPEPLTAWYTSSNSSVPMTKEEVSWMVSLVEAGAVLSPIPSGMLADVVGRKPVMLISAAVAFLGWLLVLVTRSVPYLYVARILGGMSLGCTPTVAPVYIAEVAPPAIRGALSGQMMCMFFFGQLLAYSCGPFMPYESYICFCMAISLIFFVSFLFAPETPFYYLKKNNVAAAEASMQRLRGPAYQEELNIMILELHRAQKPRNSWRELLVPQTFKLLAVLQVLCFTSRMNALPSLSLYATETLGATWITIVMGSTMTVTSFIAAFLTDPFGRKPLLFWSLLGSAVATTILAVYFIYLKEWIMFIGLFGFCVISSIGVSPMIMTLQAELFPTSTRALASAITELTVSASGFLCLKTFTPINHFFGIHVNFIMYSMLSAIGAVMVFLLPETRRSVMSSL
ncbi:uncharacterized protein [Halyomorpha halys]|uniref:uncharacterized protein n=1 Tax=Halyomorpha halys TaxID=286706 RepID=UPI0034D2BCA7